MEKFWMVWNPANRGPIVKHESEVSARNEAQRLALKDPGAAFVVLEAIAACQKTPPVVWDDLTTWEIPF